MDCNESRKLVSKEIDVELSSSEKERLEAHVASCKSCFMFRKYLQEISLLHRSMPEFPIREELVLSITDRASLLQGIGQRSWLGKLAVSAAAAAIFVLGLLIGNIVRERYMSAYFLAQTHSSEMESLEYLDEFPPGSISGLFLASGNEGGAME